MVELDQQSNIRQAAMAIFGLGGLLKDDLSISQAEILLAISHPLGIRSSPMEEWVELNYPLAVHSEGMWLGYKIGFRINKYEHSLIFLKIQLISLILLLAQLLVPSQVFRWL